LHERLQTNGDRGNCGRDAQQDERVAVLAARDPDVKSIKITQYRVAQNSTIVNALIKAAHRGKEVTAFVEVKARFDEEVNIRSAEEMQKAGVKVLYSLPGIKVHAKMALISRMENGAIKDYAYLATGNFNEKTAKLYTDFGFITTDKRLTKEINLVFDFLEGKIKSPEFEHLLVAQFNMRKVFTHLIEQEISNAKEGKKAAITAKMNSLEDEKIIKRLYEASNAGVNINLIVRGICCLVPGQKPSAGMTGELCSQPPLGVAETMLPQRSMMSRWQVSPATTPNSLTVGSPTPPPSVPSSGPTVGSPTPAPDATSMPPTST
jgi:polyphosphate kinase 1